MFIKYISIDILRNLNVDIYISLCVCMYMCAFACVCMCFIHDSWAYYCEFFSFDLSRENDK